MVPHLRTPLSRRTLLRGLGVGLALPWLECMQRTRWLGAAEAQPAPQRLAVLFMPNGVKQDCWTPTGTGRDFQLSQTLAPLADFQQDLLVLTNLWNKHSAPGDGHYVKTAGLLTGTTINKTVGVDLNCNGVSFDQVAAQGIGHLTPLPSLELGIEPVAVGVDGVVGYTRVYGAHISWKGPTSPLAKEIHPRLVYQRLLRAADRNTDSVANDRRLLDLVLEDAQRLQGSLGVADRRRMDEYLESIRSVEQRLDNLERTDREPWQPRSSLDETPAPPEAIPDKHAEHVRLMLDMIVLAFQTDITRISTFMFGNSVSNINFSFLPEVHDAHHSLSHHQHEADKLRQYELIARWHMEQMAYLLGRLRSIQEGESNLLDSSMVLFGSDLRDGNSHNPHNLPIVVAGKAGGRLRSGLHLEYPKDTPLCNLYLSMLHALDLPLSAFSDSTGPLDGVLA
jgi:hypothetical protein